MKRLFKGIYTEEGDLSRKGIVFIVMVSVVVALLLDVSVHYCSAYTGKVEVEPRYTLQEIMSMGYIKVR